MKMKKVWLVTMLVVACLIVAGALLFYHMRSNEASAKGRLVMLSSSLLVYRDSCRAYPEKLSDLKSDQGCRAFMMVTDDLLMGHGDGYDFRYEPRDANSD